MILFQIIQKLNFISTIIDHISETNKFMIFYQLPNLFLGHKLFLESSVIYSFHCALHTNFFKVQMLEDQALNFPDTMVAVSQPELGRMVCGPEQQINHALVILPLTSGVYDVICSCSIVKIDNDNTDSSVAENNDFVSNYPKIKLYINDN